MATRSRRRSLRRRVRRNPPAMTPAMRRKIGARIRALHRAGKYRKVARRAKVRRAVSRAVSVFRPSSRRRPARRSARRSLSFRGGSVGAGPLGLKSVLSRDNLVMAGGALGATFLTNYGTALIAPRLPGQLGNNPFVRAALKLAITGVTAKLAARYSRPLAQGVLLGGLLVVANDMIRQFGLPGGTTAQYLGGRRSAAPGIAQYLGGQRALAPVSPTNPTFSRMGGVYGGGSAFKSDAWSR